jgi:hypothetical protein
MSRRSHCPKVALCATVLSVIFFSFLASAQNPAVERTFPQSKIAVEKALKGLQPFCSGRLPTLDGFAVPGDRPLDRFQRGYFQCTTQVVSNAAGDVSVRVSAKITAWYAGATQEQSGYQVLASNGRLESDLLDRLAEALGDGTAATAPNAPPKSVPSRAKTTPAPTYSATSAAMPDAPSTSAASQAFHASAAPENEVTSVATQKAVVDRHLESLRTDAKNLQEILRNQSHPTNLVAVKKSGTPIFATPNEGAKVLFQAAAEDEFEMLDMNASWIHVRVSGISRGWILRSAVEMNGASADSAPPAEPAPTLAAEKIPNAKRFTVEHEEIASFPATWEPLKGKTVKIVSVQPATPTGGDSQAKRDFAKSVFEKEYAELTAAQTTAAGVVLIFDSADGGMLAAPMAILRQWKEGTLSDEAMWRRCYVDPPEMFSAPASR